MATLIRHSRANSTHVRSILLPLKLSRARLAYEREYTCDQLSGRLSPMSQHCMANLSKPWNVQSEMYVAILQGTKISSPSTNLQLTKIQAYMLAIHKTSQTKIMQCVKHTVVTISCTRQKFFCKFWGSSQVKSLSQSNLQSTHHPYKETSDYDYVCYRKCQ